MGRAMIIICAGVLVSVGYVGFGTNQQARQVIGSNAGYAEIVQAKNAAHTGIQMVMQEINDVKALDDGTEWWDDHYNENTAWTKSINGSTVGVYAEVIYEASDADSYWQPDTIRVISTADYFDPMNEDERTTKIVSIYRTSAIDDYVPDFEAALTSKTNNINPNFDGSAALSGNDAAGICEDKPAMNVPSDMDQSQLDEIQTEMNNLKEVQGSLEPNSENNYESTAEMIDRLENSGNVNYVPGGSYKGSLGTAENPGVFIIEEDVTLTGGIDDGYGILIIRDAFMKTTLDDVEQTVVDIAGNFTFNGLVIFENVHAFQGAGTPDINGSVLIGQTDEYLESNPGAVMDVNLAGDITVQYDCRGEDYAKMAAAVAIERRRFRRLSTFE